MNSNKEYKFTKEHRDRISAALKNKPKSEEQKIRLQTLNIGRTPWNKGLKEIYSEETKILMGIDKIGKHPTFDTIQKMKTSRQKFLEIPDNRKMCSNKKENHPNWKGGITPLHKQIQMCREMENWRIAIFERDNYKDWFSGCNVNGNGEVHHIKSRRKIIKENRITTIEQALNCSDLWDINNGITMLKTSHSAYHSMWGN